MGKNRRRRAKQNRRRVVRMRIEELPDDVLLGIFDFCVNVYRLSGYGGKPACEAWQSLIHVCRRWRTLVLESPRRLDLRLSCTPQTPAKDNLDLWPALPLIVAGDMTSSSDTDNVIAALGQSNRVCEVLLSDLSGSQLAEVLVPMQMSFPEMTLMRLMSHDETLTAIPDSFLGGSAPPGLQYFSLSGIPFPGLPSLLSSAHHLVSLWLSDIPHSGYISPKAMVALLSSLTSLDTFYLRFQSPRSRPGLSIPPKERSILHTLNKFHFKGVSEYLEELVARIVTPRLNTFYITFFNQIDFDCPRLAQFIDFTPTLRAPDEAHMQLDDTTAGVKLGYRTSEFELGYLLINISCSEPDWQLSSLEQVSNSSLRLLPTIEDLYIQHEYSEVVWKNDAIENDLWLRLLRPFTAVKNLYLSEEFASSISAALQELVGLRTAEVLPSLASIFVEGFKPSGPFQRSIGRFVGARRLSGHPIVISNWDTDSDLE